MKQRITSCTVCISVKGMLYFFSADVKLACVLRVDPPFPCATPRYVFPLVWFDNSMFCVSSAFNRFRRETTTAITITMINKHRPIKKEIKYSALYTLFHLVHSLLEWLSFTSPTSNYYSNDKG